MTSSTCSYPLKLVYKLDSSTVLCDAAGLSFDCQSNVWECRAERQSSKSSEVGTRFSLIIVSMGGRAFHARISPLRESENRGYARGNSGIRRSGIGRNVVRVLRCPFFRDALQIA